MIKLSTSREEGIMSIGIDPSGRYGRDKVVLSLNIYRTGFHGEPIAERY
jgi:hypothetical protein